MKKPKALFAISLVALVAIFSLNNCSSDDNYEIWGESVAGSIGAAIMMTQGTGNVNRDLDASTKVCPSINNPTPALAACKDYTGDGVNENAAGAYLRRAWLLCQFGIGQSPPWWRTYHFIKFSSQAKCSALQTSTDGFTAANITANLLTDTVTLEYGLGPNGDQVNMRFAQNGEILFLYSTFSSGWKIARKGGTTVRFPTATERRLLFTGIHAENYTTLYGNVRVPTDVYNDYTTKQKADVLKAKWDRTIHSQAVGDRTYQKSAPEEDPTATANSEVVVQTVAGVPVAKVGSVIESQHNLRLALGLSSITADMKYTDSKCCWPTEGELTTTFPDFFNLPSAGGKAFKTEILQFSATCGQVTIIQKGGGLGDTGKTRTATLYHCH